MKCDSCKGDIEVIVISGVTIRQCQKCGKYHNADPNQTHLSC